VGAGATQRAAHNNFDSVGSAQGEKEPMKDLYVGCIVEFPTAYDGNLTGIVTSESYFKGSNQYSLRVWCEETGWTYGINQFRLIWKPESESVRKLLVSYANTMYLRSLARKSPGWRERLIANPDYKIF
jgi:hypothetical protein